MGSLTSHNAIGRRGLLRAKLYFTCNPKDVLDLEMRCETVRKDGFDFRVLLDVGFLLTVRHNKRCLFRSLCEEYK
jgi:hypothetical protein